MLKIGIILNLYLFNFPFFFQFDEITILYPGISLRQQPTDYNKSFFSRQIWEVKNTQHFSVLLENY